MEDKFTATKLARNTIVVAAGDLKLADCQDVSLAPGKRATAERSIQAGPASGLNYVARRLSRFIFSHIIYRRMTAAGFYRGRAALMVAGDRAVSSNATPVYSAAFMIPGLLMKFI